MTRDAFGTPLTPEPLPDGQVHPLLALWVHVDLDGTATYGGRMSAGDVIRTLRFLADHLETAARELTDRDGA